MVEIRQHIWYSESCKVKKKVRYHKNSIAKEKC